MSLPANPVLEASFVSLDALTDDYVCVNILGRKVERLWQRKTCQCIDKQQYFGAQSIS